MFYIMNDEIKITNFELRDGLKFVYNYFKDDSKCSAYENVHLINTTNLHLPINTNVVCIKIGNHFNQPLNNIKFPDSIKYINFGYCFNQPLDNIKFPDTLQTIILSHNFNKSLDNVKFPESLKTLVFGKKFDKPIDDIKFPNSLQKIIFGCQFNRSFKNVKFPNSLQSITFGNFFDQPFNDAILPNSVQDISFCSGCSFNFNAVKYPKSLQRISFRDFIYKHDHGKHVLPNTIRTFEISNSCLLDDFILPDDLQELVLDYVTDSLTNLPLKLKKIILTKPDNTSLYNIKKSKIPYGCDVIVLWR